MTFRHSGTQQSTRLSEIKNIGYTWMAKYNQLTFLHFKGLRSRPDQIWLKYPLLQPFSQHRTLSDDRLTQFACVMVVLPLSAFGKMRSKDQGHGQNKYSQRRWRYPQQLPVEFSAVNTCLVLILCWSCLVSVVFRLLGVLLARVINSPVAITQERSPVELLNQLFTFHLSSRSALQKSCTAYVISEWAAASVSHCCMLIPVSHLQYLSK